MDKKELGNLALLLNNWSLSRNNFETIIMNYPSFNTYSYRIKAIIKPGVTTEQMRPVDIRRPARIDLPRIK